MTHKSPEQIDWAVKKLAELGHEIRELPSGFFVLLKIMSSDPVKREDILDAEECDAPGALFEALGRLGVKPPPE